METFDFYLDTKVTTWYRTPFEIEAETLEAAKQKAVEFIDKDRHTEISWEQIDETIELMSVKENDNQSTQELYYEPVGDIIWANGKV